MYEKLFIDKFYDGNFTSGLHLLRANNSYAKLSWLVTTELS
jgi:hypothetical protein